MVLESRCFPLFFLKKTCLALGVLCCFLLQPALADNWQTTIHENGAPAALVGVDKKHKIFNFYEKKSPLSLRHQYPCVTGQLSGDKQQVNDLRTPEGVYFVEYKIANGLDFKEYGGIAYTLNYPNPVDKLRGKTGYGIWIHSKGFGLQPTKGCVAIDLDPIAEVGPKLVPGLPVIVAEELNGVSDFDNGVPAQLKSLMASWTRAWADRSPEMFAYYDPEAYSKATENFETFRLNKERLFKTLSFIKIFNREIHALEGPGYWVTWAEQLYTASNLSTEGIRRLYWQKNKDGHYRIVGMEWIPRDMGMNADFRKGKLVAEGLPQTATDAFSEAPKPPRLDMPEQSAQETAPVLQPQPQTSAKPLTASVAALAEKLSVGEPLVPKRQSKSEPPDEIVWGIGKKLTEPESEESSQPAEQAQEVVEEPNSQPQKKEPVQAQEQEIIKPGLKEEDGQKLVKNWLAAISGRDAAIDQLYDQKNFNRLPHAFGVPRYQTLNTHLQGVRRDFGQPWLEVVNRAPQCKLQGEVMHCEMEFLLVNPQGARQGLQELWWKADADGEAKIVGARFTPRAYGLEANYLERVSNDIGQMIENWRKSWEGARMDDYINYYAADAWQQGRAGAKTIRRQKENLWNKIRPTLVQLSGLRLSMDPRGIRADMNQVYADSAGKSDKGVKTLLLRFDGKDWRIQREDWVALPPQG